MEHTKRQGARSAVRLGVASGLVVLAGLAGAAGCTGDAEVPEEAAMSLLTVPAWSPADEGDHVPLERGTYLVPRSGWSVADYRVTLPKGWTVQYGHAFAQHGDEPDEFGFYAVVVDEIFASTCAGEEGRTVRVGPGVDAFVDALLEQRGGHVVSDPVSTRLAGRPATRVDLRIPRSLDLDRCQMAQYGYAGMQVWYSEPADKYFVLLPGAVASVYVMDVSGQRQVFLTQVNDPRSAEDRAELRAVLASIRIEG